jgi:Sec-independent protein translocase protein TatA
VFGIGPTEFIIIAVVALMLFSPRELPKILRSAAKFWASLRNTADEFRDAIMNEEEMHDIRAALKGGVSDIKKAEAAARRELMKARMEMQKAQNKLLKTVKAAEESKREELGVGVTAPNEGAAPVHGSSAPADGAPAAPDAHHTDAHHTDAHHTDAHHTDAHHTDAHHTDAHHTDAHHSDAHHTDAHHTDTTPSANSGNAAAPDPREHPAEGHPDAAMSAPPGAIPAARPDRPDVGQGAA